MTSQPMTSQPLPNWARIILLALTLISFWPQLDRIRRRRECSGISQYYVLLNLISATEQFTLGFFFVVTNTEGSDYFINQPLDVGDWLNLFQLASVWILWSFIFAACLYYPSNHGDCHKAAVASIYISFSLISILPLFIDAIYIVEHQGNDEYRKWGLALFFGVHSMMLSPVITFLGVMAMFPQRRILRAQSPRGAFSIAGLAAQASVFSAVAVSWIFRVTFPYSMVDLSDLNLIVTWYQLVGWATVDNAVFVIVQSILLLIAICRRRETSATENVSRESQPLLRT